MTEELCFAYHNINRVPNRGRLLHSELKNWQKDYVVTGRESGFVLI